MDTRFWGPPAWVLLHTLAYHYKPELKSEYKIFFNNLKHVLPCIYCRVSFTEYTEALPIDNYLNSKEDIFKWLYEIHNMVNDKLRIQGLIHWENPSLAEIINRYKSFEIDNCQVRDKSIMGWNFLYSIAFNYPEDGLTTIQTSHYHGYLTFFNFLGKLLMGKYQELYNEYLNNNSIVDSLKDRECLQKWVYNLELHMNKFLKLKCSSFVEIEELIESYRAGCGGIKKDTKPTCRKKN
jgi:hypothetical protein